MKKKIVMLAITLIATISSITICLAVDFYTREDNPKGNVLSELSSSETMKNNNGLINVNNGIVEFNYNQIDTNNGTVRYNRSTIMINNGTVENNYSYNLLTNNGIVINDYIAGYSDRNNLNAQNTFYLVDFRNINKDIITIDWQGPTDELGNYYYGNHNNSDVTKIGASFAVTTVDDGYEITNVSSETATLSKSGKNVYDISYDGDSIFDISIEYLPIITEVSTTGGTLMRMDYSLGFQNNYRYINYQIIADYGYEIADVLINNISVGAVEKYKLENVTSPTTIKAVFRKTQPEVPDTSDKGILLWCLVLILSLISLMFIYLKNRKKLS